MKHVVITGANRGIGLEFVRQLSARDWRIIATARRPDEGERATLRRLLDGQQAALRAQPALAAARCGDFDLPEGVTQQQLGAWQAVAQTLLNLHETITKE